MYIGFTKKKSDVEAVVYRSVIFQIEFLSVAVESLKSTLSVNLLNSRGPGDQSPLERKIFLVII